MGKGGQPDWRCGILTENADQARISEMRKSGLNIMMSMKSTAKPVSFAEDCAVPLADLADYTAELTKIFSKYNTRHVVRACLGWLPSCAAGT